MAVTIANTLDTFSTVAGSSTPAFLTSDGHTVGWYIYDDVDSITQDGSHNVSEWADYLDSGNDLIGSGVGTMPVWTSDGVDFSVYPNDFLTASFTLIQPTEIYLVFKNIEWSSSWYIFDGYTADSGSLYEDGTTPQIIAYAGTGSSSISPTLGTWCIVRVVFNGASSKLQLNNNAAVTGNWGAANMGGIRLGGYSGGGYCSSIIVKELIIRNVADSSSDEAEIITYLNDTYSIY
jgi:hypothetical protein